MIQQHTQRLLAPDAAPQELMGGIEVDDLAHALHVAKLADDLFHLTLPLHGMGDREADLLLRGALLHDAGISVAYRGHHKESLRLIAHARFGDLTRDEQMIAACIARYHRKALPRKSHSIYRSLPRALQQQVNELGGILRLADAFDYEHDGSVTRLDGHVISNGTSRPQVILCMVHHFADEASLQETLARADFKRDLFERAFHCEVSITAEAESPSGGC
jgi:exopolyphosphatase/pppGpp-phosphohydrolase